jgi:hypothetical protein
VGLSGHGDIFGFATTTSKVVIESTGVSVETVAVWSPSFLGRHNIVPSGTVVPSLRSSLSFTL